MLWDDLKGGKVFVVQSWSQIDTTCGRRRRRKKLGMEARWVVRQSVREDDDYYYYVSSVLESSLT